MLKNLVLLKLIKTAQTLYCPRYSRFYKHTGIFWMLKVFVGLFLGMNLSQILVILLQYVARNHTTGPTSPKLLIITLGCKRGTVGLNIANEVGDPLLYVRLNLIKIL